MKLHNSGVTITFIEKELLFIKLNRTTKGKTKVLKICRSIQSSSLRAGSCIVSEMRLKVNTLDTFFRQIKLFLRFRLAFVFGLQTYYLIDFSRIY